MIVDKDRILKLTQELYPTGRAFAMFEGSTLDAFHMAIANGEEEAIIDAIAILDSIIPDNPNFSEDDASDWERRLGLINGTGVDLEDRKKSILRKQAFPGNSRTRGSAVFIEAELQAAGFNLYVHENPANATPESIYSGSFINDLEHGEIEHGEGEHGGIYGNFVANSITQAGDTGFNVGSNFQRIIFIGGQTIGTYANVDVNREAELRQLILRLKHAHIVAMLFVNYI